MFENYTVTFVRMRWPERERTIIEKGAAACECISSMKEEIRLLVGQIDDLECRLDEETADLSQQLEQERGKVRALEGALQDCAKKCAECEQARQRCAEVLAARDKKILSLESTIHGKLKEMARGLEEQTSVAQLLRIRQTKLTEGYDAKVKELKETAQAVVNSMEHMQQSSRPPLELLHSITSQILQMRAVAGDKFRSWDEAIQRLAPDISAVPLSLQSLIARSEKYEVRAQGELKRLEEVLCFLENDITLMRSLTGATQFRCLHVHSVCTCGGMLTLS